MSAELCTVQVIKRSGHVCRTVYCPGDQKEWICLQISVSCPGDQKEWICLQICVYCPGDQKEWIGLQISRVLSR